MIAQVALLAEGCGSGMSELQLKQETSNPLHTQKYICAGMLQLIIVSYHLYLLRSLIDYYKRKVMSPTNYSLAKIKS